MTTAVAERPKRAHRKDYTDAEIETALRAFAICSGRKTRAAELLKQQGVEVPEGTIRYWAYTSKREDYAKIRQEVADALREQMADVQQALAHGAAEIEAEAIELLKARLRNKENPMEDKNLVNLLKNSGLTGAVNIDKAQLLNGQPTQIVQRSASEIIRKLESKGVVIEGQVLEEETVQGVGSGA